MPIIDLHCDTIYEIHYATKKQDLYKNNLQIDIQKMKESQVLAQMFALYIDQEKMIEESLSPMEYTARLKETFDLQMGLYHGHIKYAANYDDIIQNNRDNKISALLSIEGGEALEGEIGNLAKVYDWGVRALTLTWNHANEIGFPHTLTGGITPFGKDITQYANELGIILDVSHLSDQGFWDILSLSDSPIIASHSNARAICNHTRNLSDEMIKGLAEKGGIIGANLYGLFVNKSGESTIFDIVRHINHLYQVGGIESIALGSDFDGFEGGSQIAHAGQWEKLIHQLRKEKMPESNIDKITYENTLRIIKDVL